MKKIFLLLVVFTTLISCSSDSNSSLDTEKGQWKLVYVNGPFEQASYTFEPGIITWDFNSITHMVTVVNNNTNNNLNGIFDTGVYTYEIFDNTNPNSCSQLIKIDGVQMGCFSIVNNELTIDQTSLDGFGMHLIH